MKKVFLSILLVFSLCEWSYSQGKQKNILLLCIDDLRPELKSFGVAYIHSPNIDKLANSGRVFLKQYVNAPSCGPSRYTLLTGNYGSSKNQALFDRMEYLKNNPQQVPMSMPEWFRQQGYTTVSVGKVSHDPGGLGGKDWNDPNVIEMPNAWDKSLMPVAEWEHPRGAMHGLAHGEIREGNKKMDVFQSAEGSDTIYPDGHITIEAIKQLNDLVTDQKKPFFLAVGLLKPHLPFGAPKKYMDLYEGVQLPELQNTSMPEKPSTWHNSGEYMQYNNWGKDPRIDKEFAIEVRKHYAACVSYADAQVGMILEKLKETGADKNTIIVLWGDHGWNLGEHHIWGKHNLFEEALRSPLIISYPQIPHPGKSSNEVVEAIDIFPTLCDLANIKTPNFISGLSLKKILENPKATGHVAVGYNGSTQTIRTDRYRLIVHQDGQNELYDHEVDPFEIENRAANNPRIVRELKELLSQKLATRKIY